MSLGLLLFAAVGATVVPLITSTPEQRIYAARIVRRAMDLSRHQEKEIALAQNGKDPAQWSRELAGAGRVDFALLLACPAAFLRALAQAIGEAAGADPHAEAIAEAVADRLAARLTTIKPQMARAALSADNKEAACS